MQMVPKTSALLARPDMDGAAHSDTAPNGLPARLVRVLERTAIGAIVTVIVLQALIRWRPDDFFFEPSYYFVHQDLSLIHI